MDYHIDPNHLLEIAVDKKAWFYWKDPAGNYLGCNDLMAIDLGLKSSSEIVGRKDYDLFSEEEANVCCESDQAIFKTQFPQQVSDKATTSKNIIDFSTIKIPLLTKNSNKVVAVFGMSFYSTKKIIPKNVSNDIYHNENVGMTIDGVYLNSREIFILQLLVRGKSAKEIAVICHRSKRTIESHLEKIKHKINVNSKSKLIDKVIDYLNLTVLK